jgi:anti-anti-sigma factor
MSSVGEPGLEVSQTTAADGATELALSGYIDLATVGVLADALAIAFDGARAIRLNLADLTFLDSTGLREFLQGYHRAEAEGVGYQVVNPRGHIRQVLEVTGTYDYLTEGLEPTN